MSNTSYPVNLIKQIKESLSGARTLFRQEVGMLTETFQSDILHTQELYAGSRFLSDDRVIQSMEQRFTPHEASKYLNYALFLALEDCASADYHYMFLKEW